MVRYNASSQPNAQAFKVQIADGSFTTAWHPPVMVEGINSFFATSSNFGKGDKYNEWFMAYTSNGTYGIASTCKNSCKQHASIAGCRFGDNCHFYHVEPGYIMTNLPKRAPLIIGRIDARLGNSSKMADLIVWTAIKNAAINMLNDKHNEATLGRMLQARADRKARAEKQAVSDKLLADLLAEEEEPVRKKARFALPVPMLPPGSPPPPSPQFSDAPVVTPVSYAASPEPNEGDEPDEDAAMAAAPNEDAAPEPANDNAAICAILGQLN